MAQDANANTNANTYAPYSGYASNPGYSRAAGSAQQNAGYATNNGYAPVNGNPSNGYASANGYAPANGYTQGAGYAANAAYSPAPASPASPAPGYAGGYGYGPYAPAAPLSIPADLAPLPGCSLGEAVQRFFTRYALFKGAASRSEYWFMVLFNVLVETAAVVLAALFGGGQDNSNNPMAIFFGFVLVVYTLVAIIPGVALTVRRLHDAGYAGPWIFIGLVPVAGPIILIVLLVSDSNPVKWNPVWFMR